MILQTQAKFAVKESPGCTWHAQDIQTHRSPYLSWKEAKLGIDSIFSSLLSDSSAKCSLQNRCIYLTSTVLWLGCWHIQTSLICWYPVSSLDLDMDFKESQNASVLSITAGEILQGFFLPYLREVHYDLASSLLAFRMTNGTWEKGSSRLTEPLYRGDTSCTGKGQTEKSQL